MSPLLFDFTKTKEGNCPFSKLVVVFGLGNGAVPEVTWTNLRPEMEPVIPQSRYFEVALLALCVADRTPSHR